MSFTVEEFRDLVSILEQQPQWRAELRRLLLTDELLELPNVVRELAEGQRALAIQVRELVEGQSALAEEQRALVSQVRELAQKVDALVTWQRGEAGRREGERYERNMVKRAPVLFSGGRGGATDSPQVQKRLSTWLRPLLGEDRLLESDEDPTLCDLIWWKGERIAVVEVSLKVNGEDVRRALKRSKTLRSVGVDGFPVVIGEDWTSIEVREYARENGVEWIVNGVLSKGVIAFRRLSFAE